MSSADEIGPIVERIRPLLAGHSPEVQGAVLADLLAIFLAAHGVDDPDPAVEALREEILRLHIDAVRALIPINVAMLAEQRQKKPPR
jgi:hypothetical protein